MNKGLIIRNITIIFCAIGFSVVMVQANDKARTERTRAEIDALIEQAGSTAPDWWDSTELRYPNSLDMSWPVMSQGRDNRSGRGEREGRGARGGRADESNRNVDQYLYNVIYPNPSRYKEGIKLVNHLLIMHKDEEGKLRRSLNVLGQMFYELMEDYARAAFWWRKFAEKGGSVDPVKMARCYWELGSKEIAVEELSRISGNYHRNNDDVIRLWAKMGEVDKAIKMTETSSGSNMQAHSYLLAAEICRQAGRFDEAIKYYQKVIALPDGSTRPRDHHEVDGKIKANANMTATRLLSILDLKRVPDGTYTGSSVAYGGTLYIKVTVGEGSIKSVEITQHRETPSYFIMAEQTARQIVSRQSLNEVDVITGATMTSDAIINAAAGALAGAMK
ncbi:MAG: FMN-binding protein [Sedimentisphaerales bacterium]|nr:FMN-binding protein [Sedimentisphaerales bacterium]